MLLLPWNLIYVSPTTSFIILLDAEKSEGNNLIMSC